MLGFDALGTHPLGRFDQVVPISGMAWYGEWEPPYFPTKTKTEQIQTHFVSLTPATLPVPTSGQAYNYAWEPPFFSTKTKPELTPTHFVALTPSTLPVPVSGQAYDFPWEPPYFPSRVKVEQMPTHSLTYFPNLYVKNPLVIWYKNWEPTPQRLFPHYLQIDQMQGILLAGTLPEKAVNPGYRLRLYDVEGQKYPVFIWKGQPAATPVPIPHPPVPPLVFPEGGIWGGALGQYCLGE